MAREKCDQEDFLGAPSHDPLSGRHCWLKVEEFRVTWDSNYLQFYGFYYLLTKGVMAAKL